MVLAQDVHRSLAGKSALDQRIGERIGEYVERVILADHGGRVYSESECQLVRSRPVVQIR